MADCNTCNGTYLSVEDLIRRSVRCNSEGKVAFIGTELNVLEAETKALLLRMDVQPTAERQIAINKVVKELKKAGIWSKLDALWICAAHNEQAAKLNWIKDAHNLTKGGTGDLYFTVDKGFKSNLTSTYLNTNYTPSTDGDKYKLDDATFGIVHDGKVDRMGIHGFFYSNQTTCIGVYSGYTVANRLNGSDLWASPSVYYHNGYHAITRNNTVNATIYKRGYHTNETQSNAAVAVPTKPLFLCACNNNGTPAYYADTIIKVGFVGGHLTYNESNELEYILENYLNDGWNNGFVAFTSDDGYKSMVNEQYALFTTKGVKGTLYIPTKWLDDDPTYWVGVKAMYDAGWTIANHTETHALWGTLDETGLRAEIENSQAKWISKGISEPTNFCSPGDTINEGQLLVAKEYFKSQRKYSGLTERFNYVYPDSDEYRELNSISIDNSYRATISEQMLYDMLDSAKKYKSGIIFTFHEIHQDTGATAGVDISLLSGLIDYAKSLGLDILTMTQVGAKLGL